MAGNDIPESADYVINGTPRRLIYVGAQFFTNHDTKAHNGIKFLVLGFNLLLIMT
jgi:hypothetical protein